MDCVTVFSRTGKPLAELDAKVTRAWKLERIVDAAKAQMELPASDDKATANNLRYGNFVLVENSEGLPNWGGMIWPRTIINNGIVQLTLQSAEWMFNGRATDNKDKFAGTPYQAFNYLCHIATREWPLPISQDFVFQDTSDPVDKVWNAKCIFEAMNELAAETYSYWWLEAARKDNGDLWFIPHWQRRIGGLFRTPLVENHNLVGVRVTEEPPELANIIDCYGQFADWSDPLYSRVRDEKGFNRYGPIVAPEIFSNIASSAGLQFAGRCALKRRAHPQLLIQGNMPIPPYPEVGDVANVQLTVSHGFISKFRTQSIRMSVTDVSIDPAQGGIFVNLKEIIGGDI